jgi:hypothetical protein
MSEKAQVKDAAKRIARGQGESEEVTLSTGVVVRLKPVSSSLVEEMRNAIDMPEVPKVWIEAKEREEENPNDPRYIAAIEETNSKRAEAVFDALCIFGVELVDGLPEDDSWIKQLRLLERRGSMDLSGFDLKDEFDLEFLYKRYVAIAGADLNLISGLHGFRPLEVARARSMFLGDETGDTAGRISADGIGEDEHRDESADDGVGKRTRSKS